MCIICARAISKTCISATGRALFDVRASCAVGSTQSAAALASRRLLFAFGVFCCLLCCASRARAPGARSPPFTIHMCRTLRSPRAPAASDHSLDQVPEPRRIDVRHNLKNARGAEPEGGARTRPPTPSGDAPLLPATCTLFLLIRSFQKVCNRFDVSRRLFRRLPVKRIDLVACLGNRRPFGKWTRRAHVPARS